MGRLVIASQLDAGFNEASAQHIKDVDSVPVPRGAPDLLPGGAEVLVAAPFHRAGGALASPPPGWPFDLRWVQLVSVGIDFYPDWLFAGPVVPSARGSSAVALAEFALAAILSAA